MSDLFDRGHNWLVVVLAPVTVMCLACAFVFWFTQVRRPRPYEFGVICASVRTTDRVQFGVAWESPQANENLNLKPATYYWNPNHRYALCGRLPWSPLLLAYRGFVFP